MHPRFVACSEQWSCLWICLNVVLLDWQTCILFVLWQAVGWVINMNASSALSVAIGAAASAMRNGSRLNLDRFKCDPIWSNYRRCQWNGSYGTCYRIQNWLIRIGYRVGYWAHLQSLYHISYKPVAIILGSEVPCRKLAPDSLEFCSILYLNPSVSG